MKICISAHRFPPDIGGTELYSERLAEELHRRGHEVVVYTTETEGERDAQYTIREFTNPIPRQFGYFAWPGILSPSTIFELRTFDAVHAVNASMFSAVVGALIKTLSPSTRAVLTTTYHPPRVQAHQKLKRSYDQTILQRVLERYDRLLVSSDFELKELQQAFDLSECTVDRRDIPPIVSEKVDVETYGESTNEDTFTLLYVGRLDSHKGVLSLLYAVEELLWREQDVRCVVVGERERWYEWPDEVTSLIERNEDAFEFTGFLSDSELAHRYVTSDALVLPSKYETFGLVAVEALHYGTPVVMTPVGIAPERIRNGYNGAVYDPEDPEALVGALEELLRGDRERYRQNAVKSVSDLSWSDLTDHLEGIYQ